MHFSVTEVFASPTPNIKEIDVLTPSGGPACGFDFDLGHSYLVYAERTPSGELRTNHCMRTAPMEDASGDLAYLRSLPTLRPVGQISGFAFDSQIPMPAGGASWPWGTLPDVQVTIHSDQVRNAAATDANGRFVFSDLPAGSCTVTAAKAGYWAGAPVTAVVPAKGYADVSFNLNVDRAIAGRLLDQFGQAVPDVTVELIRGPDQLGYRQTISDARGHYQFRGLQPGEYYLGVSLTSQPLADHLYQRWYYPAGSDFSKAFSLTAGDGPEFLAVDLPLPEVQHEVTISGVVQWPDARPAPGVDVFPEDPDFPHQLGMIRFPTDTNGNFQAKLFNRTTYKLYAVMHETSGKVTSAEPVTIIPGQLREGTTIRLVLSHEGDLMTPETNKR